MAKQVINIGTAANDGTGDALRTAFNKSNDNFTELYDFDTALPAAAQTLTNKTITDVATNKVNARAVAVYVKASAAFADSLIPRPFRITGNEGADAAFLVSPLTDNTTPANGIIVGALALNAYGTGYTNGKVYNVNTSLWNVGDILWLQTDGQLGTTKPSTGYQQPIAQVVRSNANTGILHVAAGYPIPDAADVRFTPAGDITATDVQAALQQLNALIGGGGYTDAQAQDAVGGILTDTAEIDFNYDAILRLITASLKAGSIDETKLDASVNASLDLADTALQPSAIGTTVQAHSAILDATTASFTTADETKLDGIEAGADVTDATNVAAAGALMDSEVTNLAAVKAFDPADYATAAQGVLAEKCEIGVACSDETTDLTTGTAKVTFRMPYAMTLTGVRANVNTAPVGSTITVDINEGGVSVLSTLLTIDAAEKTSTTAAVPAVISDSGLADDAEITIDIDQVGSTTAGKGLKVWLIGTRA